MAKILSQDEIDALLSNVSGDEDEIDQITHQQKVSLYDFKHPNLVSKEQMRLLENIHEAVCRNFSVFLSAQLRMIVEMNLLAIDQIMYSEFVMSIAPPSCIYVNHVPEADSNFVLEINPQLAIFIVERLFGGRGGFLSTVRPISVIEQKIMRRIVERVSFEINRNWHMLADFNSEISRFESNPEFVQIVPSSEPVVVASMEVKIHGNSTLMNICYPYMLISNIVSRPDVQEKILFGAREPSHDEMDLVRFNVVNTPIDFKAVLGQGKVSIDEFVNLRQGDVIRLESRMDSSLPVYVNNKHMFDSIVGTHKKHYAVRILDRVPEEIQNGQ